MLLIHGSFGLKLLAIKYEQLGVKNNSFPKKLKTKKVFTKHFSGCVGQN